MLKRIVVLTYLLFIVGSISAINNEKLVAYIYSAFIEKGTSKEGKDILESLHNITEGYEILKQCYALAPQDAELNYQMARYKEVLHNNSGKDTLQILDFCKKAYEADSTNKKYVKALLNLYTALDDTANTIKYLEKLAILDKNNQKYQLWLMDLYEMQGKYNEIFNIINHLENLNGHTAELDIAKAGVWMNMEQPQKALKFIDKCIKKYPNEVAYRNYKARYYLSTNKYKQAIKELDTSLALYPNNAETLYSYIFCLEKMGEDKKANDMKFELACNPKTESELKVQLVKDLLEDYEGKKDGVSKMMNMFQTALLQPQDDADMTKIYIGYLQLQKYSLDSISIAMHEILQKEPTNETAQIYLLQHYSQKKDNENAMNVCKEAIKYNTKLLEFHYYLAIYQYQEGKKKESKNTLLEAVKNKQYANQKDLFASCFAMIAQLYHDEDSIKQSFDAYEECLKWNPDDIEALNNYAYFLSIYGGDLDKALRMSKKTIDKYPQKGTFLDTYAWILFMKGEYKEAEKYIIKALADYGNVSADVYEHAGDIYYHLGEKEAAIAYWQLAERDTVTTNLVKLKKKIKLKKYIK